jgi:hypothetical protein
MNYKLIIDALVVINKNSKSRDDSVIDYKKVSKKFSDKSIGVHSLYYVKDLVIKKLIAHGQLKGDKIHQFSRGGFALCLQSKFARTDDSGKVIGEFHSGFSKNIGKFTGHNFDGVLVSSPDKVGGFYTAKYTLAEAMYIVSEFIDDNSFDQAKVKKNLAMAKRRKII